MKRYIDSAQLMKEYRGYKNYDLFGLENYLE